MRMPIFGPHGFYWPIDLRSWKQPVFTVSRQRKKPSRPSWFGTTNPSSKAHNLGYLIDLCVPILPEFEQYREPAEALTPYSTNLRYPGEATVTLEEAKQALGAAESILAFIRQLIPIEK